MILNISLRTDIVACYTDWLVDKLLHKDFIYSQNPRTKVTTAYSLKDVDCIAFCSKDYSKILPYIFKNIKVVGLPRVGLPQGNNMVADFTKKPINNYFWFDFKNGRQIYNSHNSRWRR